MNYKELLLKRQSDRKYTDKAVEKEKIEADYYFDSTEKMLEILLG